MLQWLSRCVAGPGGDLTQVLRFGGGVSVASYRISRRRPSALIGRPSVRDPETDNTLSTESGWSVMEQLRGGQIGRAIQAARPVCDVRHIFWVR